jgi:hypothetical protein
MEAGIKRLFVTAGAALAAYLILAFVTGASVCAAPVSLDIADGPIIVESDMPTDRVRVIQRTGSGDVIHGNILSAASLCDPITITDSAAGSAAHANTIEVRTARPAEIWLENVTIDVSADQDACAFYMIPGADVRLVVSGNSKSGSNSLHSGAHRAGIEVPEGASLQIRSRDHPLSASPAVSPPTATLTAQSESHGAGIGGADGQSAGSITIHSGVVTAYSGGWGAGIGGGYDGGGGSFYMDGGVLEAGSSQNKCGVVGQGAGIGGGYNGHGGAVTITETPGVPPPKILAYSSWDNEGEGAGIGGGANASGGVVVINCGDIISAGGGISAYSSVNNAGNGAGIGGGFRGACGTVIVMDYNGSISAAKSSGISTVVSAPGSGAGIGAGLQNSDHGNQLILTHSATGDYLIGNVILPDIALPGGNTVYTISAADKLVVPAGTSLTILNNVTLTNKGIIENYGTINNDWRFENDGTITNKATIWTSGSYVDNTGSSYTGAAPVNRAPNQTRPPDSPDPNRETALPNPFLPTIPAANRAVWVDYSLNGAVAYLYLTPAKTRDIVYNSGDGTADIDLSELNVNGVGVTELSFPRQALIEFADRGLDVELRMPRGVVHLNRAAAWDIAGQGNNTQLRMRFSPVRAPALNAARLAALRGGDVAYELTISVGGQDVHSFDGAVTLTVPYAGALPAGAWYLGEDGRRERAESYYENGSLRFTARRCALFAVGRGGDDEASTGNLPWYYVK